MATQNGGVGAVLAALAVVALLLMTSAVGGVTSTSETTANVTTPATNSTGGVTSTPEPTANVTSPATNSTGSTNGTIQDPCSSPADCLEGLVCTNSECACPQGCEYDVQEIACSCGAAWTEWNTYAPLVYGLPVNIIIWCVCFKCTKKLMTKNNRTLPLHPASRVVNPTGGVFVVSSAPNAAGPSSMMSSSETSGPLRRQVNKNSMAVAS